jgi:hypothetical protein
MNLMIKLKDDYAKEFFSFFIPFISMQIGLPFPMEMVNSLDS